MYCPKCGAYLEDNSSFCVHCGTKNNGGISEPPLVSDYVPPSRTQGSFNNYNSNKSKSISNKTKFLIIGAIAIVVIAVVLIIILSNGRTHINLNKYLTISVSGCDGYGSAEYYIDKDKLEADYSGKIKLTSSGKDNFLLSAVTQYGDEDPIDMIASEINGSLNQTSDLSNGDEIFFEWDYDGIDELETYVNVSLGMDDYRYKVSGLKTAESIDYFNYVSVSYVGAEPNGTARVYVSCDWLSSNNFSVSKSSGLSNGDIVKVSINDEMIPDIISKSGYKPIETSREYKVEGLSEYITSLSQIPGNSLERMKESTTEKLEEHIGENERLLSADYLGAYLILESTLGNQIYLIYSISVNETVEDDSQDVTFYWYIEYNSGVINNDGDFLIDYDNLTVPEYTETSGLFSSGYEGDYVEFSLSNHGFIYPGFESLDDLKLNIGASGTRLLDSTVYQ